MNKNYYEILEVDKNASAEVIEKAYKALVKKYHPDLQEEKNKALAEEKIKLINEAYDTLSNFELRLKYDEELKKYSISEDEYNKLYQENQILHNEIDKLKNNTSNNAQNSIYTSPIERARSTPHVTYYTKTQKDVFKEKLEGYFKNFLALIITIAILFLIYQIPFVKNFFTELYNTNPFVKAIVDIFSSLFGPNK